MPGTSYHGAAALQHAPTAPAHSGAATPAAGVSAPPPGRDLREAAVGLAVRTLAEFVARRSDEQLVELRGDVQTFRPLGLALLPRTRAGNACCFLAQIHGAAAVRDLLRRLTAGECERRELALGVCDRCERLVLAETLAIVDGPQALCPGCSEVAA